MDRLAAVEAFVRVVDRNGFSAAANDLGMSPAMVSKHVKDLEERLGARLLHRTTRRVSLTEIGRVYYDRWTRILADIAEADEAVGEFQAEPRGLLRINAPMSFGTMHLAAAVADFTSQHPHIQVDLTLNDRVVDLLEEGYDLAVRIGRLADSSLVARRLAPCRIVACASPSYLQAHGHPRRPGDLVHHACLSYTYTAVRGEWRFDGPEGPVSVKVGGPLQANNGEALRAAALKGQGIILQPTFIVGDDLRAGRLVPVLPDYRAPEFALHAVYPHARHLSTKVRSFVDFLAGRYGQEPEWDAWMRTKD